MSYKIVYSIIFFPVFFFIGLITSYEDFRFFKIKNKWILVGLIYSLSVYLFTWILYGLGARNSYLLWHFDKWCVNLVVSSLVAYSLWHFKMWGAGDAKLFICYSSLIPIGQYSRIYFNYYFASFLLLLSIFFPATAFLLLKSSIYFIKRLNLGEIRKIAPGLIRKKLSKFNMVETGKVIFGFFVLFLFFRILRENLQNFLGKILPDQNILALISLVAFRQLFKIFKKNARFIVIVFVILIAYVSFKLVYSWGQLISEVGNIFARSASVMILFPLFRKIIGLYEERVAQKTIPFAIWMFLGALIIWFL